MFGAIVGGGGCGWGERMYAIKIIRSCSRRCHGHSHVTLPYSLRSRYCKQCQGRLAGLETGTITLSQGLIGLCYTLICFSKRLIRRATLEAAPVDRGSPRFVTPPNKIRQPDTMQATTKTKTNLAGIRAKAGLLVASEGLLSSCPRRQSSL
jgi:RNase P subunit RPR2